MADVLAGGVALVTGAAARLGRHLALCAAEAGADVVVHYHRQADAAEETAECVRERGRRAWCIPADFRSGDDVASMMRRIAADVGSLSVIVNNVGNYPVKPLAETDWEDWSDTLRANLVAPAEIVRRGVELFPTTGGSVVNIGYAGVENLAANTVSTAYQVSKTGLLVLTKSLARDLAPRGIRVNMISPGQLENSVDLPEDVARAIPLGRAGTLEDVGSVFLFLCRPDSYVTGVNIDVAGGYRL